jgi:hydrogenase maturation protease
MSITADGAGSNPSSTIKVIGIGQSLRGDDAAGLEAVRTWYETYEADNPRPNVAMQLAELPGIALLSMLEGTRYAILVDAVRSGATPGTIHQISEDELDAFTKGAGSAHGWGVAETLTLGRMLNPSELPETLILIGIEVGQLTLGDTLTAEVRSALPEVSRLIEQLVCSVQG